MNNNNKIYYLNNDFSHSPYFNLALEEYLLKNSKDNFFILWQNEPTVVVGYHQNTIAEINLSYIKEKKINIVRRMTGGGTVYHDLGNVIFSFIENIKKNTSDFKKYILIIIEALNKIGIEAHFFGRNDILIGEKKISGNSELISNNRILHHGTLLFNSDLEEVFKTLNVESVKFTGKSIKSVHSRVVNICDYLPNVMNVNEFIQIIMREVKTRFLDSMQYELSDYEIKQIQQLAENKYSTWEWNFGNSPKYNFSKTTKTNAGTLEIYMDVSKGIIENIKIYGDFFFIADIKDVEKCLIGVRHNRSSILTSLNNINIQDYFVNLTKEEFLKSII